MEGTRSPTAGPLSPEAELSEDAPGRMRVELSPGKAKKW